MADPYVREVGRLEDAGGDDIVVGVDYDTVVIDSYGSHLTQAQAEEFAQLFVSAVWQAGQQKARMDAEVSDGAAGDDALAFEVSEDCSFELACPDCGRFLYFSADQPEPGGVGLHSNLSLGAVVEAAKAHKCENDADD